MKKLLENDLSYYRFDTHAGNIVYFSHEKKAAEHEYIDFDIKDVITKIDDLVDAYHAILEVNSELSAKIKTLEDKLESLIATPPTTQE